jgi:hypothetical protein
MLDVPQRPDWQHEGGPRNYQEYLELHNAAMQRLAELHNGVFNTETNSITDQGGCEIRLISLAVGLLQAELMIKFPEYTDKHFKEMREKRFAAHPEEKVFWDEVDALKAERDTH